MNGCVKETSDKLFVSISSERIHTPNAKLKKEKNPERYSQSISRAKREIKEYAECNDWSCFGTLTFSPGRVKQESINTMVAEAIECLNKIKKAYQAQDMRWVIVPEPYTDRRRQLHMHCLMAGIPDEALQSFSRRKGKKPRYVYRAAKAGQEIYTLPEYEAKMGYALLEPLQNIDAATHYMMKSLDDARTYAATGKHLYYVSQGLRRAEKIAKGHCGYEAEKEIEQRAEAQYPHRAEKGGTIFGKTYALENTAENRAKLLRLFSSEESNEKA